MTSEERREARYQRRQKKRQLQKLSRTWEYDYFPSVFCYGNLYRAYRKCRLGVAWKGSTQKFITQAPLEVFRIWDNLDKNRWKSKGFYEFDIFERGKARHIKSVTMDERVVQRCLCDNALVPVLQPTFIYDNGASTKDKGYHFAISRCEKHPHDHYRKHGQTGYVLTFDFSKFFDNVDHTLIEDIVRNNFTDQRLIDLTHYLVHAFGDKGLGLGSQVSQTFALASANRLDHYCKEVLQIHGYGRCMDDGYLISESKEYLQYCLTCIQQICDELHIKLNTKKTRITKLSKGFTFLKCKFFLTSTGKVVKKIYKESVTKMRRKLKKLFPMMMQGILTYQDVYQAFQSWRSYAAHFDAWHAIRNMDQLFDKLLFSYPGYLY